MSDIVLLPVAPPSLDHTPCPFIRATVILDRAQTRKLRNDLLKVESDAPGYRASVAQLNAMLERRDWILISVGAPSPDHLREFGFNIGIAEARPLQPRKPKLSPLQRWQRAQGTRGAR